MGPKELLCDFRLSIWPECPDRIRLRQTFRFIMRVYQNSLMSCGRLIDNEHLWTSSQAGHTQIPRPSALQKQTDSGEFMDRATSSPNMDCADLHIVAGRIRCLYSASAVAICRQVARWSWFGHGTRISVRFYNLLSFPTPCTNPFLRVCWNVESTYGVCRVLTVAPQTLMERGAAQKRIVLMPWSYSVKTDEIIQPSLVCVIRRFSVALRIFIQCQCVYCLRQHIGHSLYVFSYSTRAYVLLIIICEFLPYCSSIMYCVL